MIAPAAALLAGAAGGALVVVLLQRHAARLPAAAPNERTLHDAPVPRVGGLALWAGFLPVALAVGDQLPGGRAGWLPALAALGLVSLADDARGVPIAMRLVVHAGAAAWAAAFLLGMAGAALPEIAPGAGYALALAGVTLTLMWCANLYNFMDGSDGLAGMTTLVGFGALAIGAAQDAALRAAGLALAGASVPFLLVNRPPARMFLGDVGAVPAGFVAALFAWGGILRGDWPFWFPMLIFLPFLADSSLTLLRRALRGERVWQAHRSHYYQRFHQLGAGHAGTLAAYTLATLATAATAVLCLRYAPQAGAAALGAWLAAFAVLFATIDYHWRRRPTATR